MEGLNRRDWIKLVGGIGLTSLAGCGLRPNKLAKPLPPGLSFLTPVEKFFHVSINPNFKPRLAEDWTINLIGVNGQRESITRTLIGPGNSQIYRTIACIGNPVGGAAIGNAQWTVVPLRDILRPILPRRTGEFFITFQGHDGYWSSVPVEVAIAEDSYLAYEMNGAPLTAEGGYPARILLPRLYGTEQVRWLKQIQVVRRAPQGYWQRRGWKQPALVKPITRIDYPAPFSIVDQSAPQLRGIAFAGGAAVKLVELTFDQGVTWQPVTMMTDPAPNVWTLWQYDQALSPGRYVVSCRVTDNQGYVQPEALTDPKPDGATGWHTVHFAVK